MVSALTASGRYLHLVLFLFAFTTKGNGFEVEINIDTPAVKIGGSLNVTCRTTCLNPTIDMELKSGLNIHCIQVNNSNTCQFPIGEKWDLPVVCIVTCKSENNTQKDVKKEITVYNQELVITSHPEVMEINKTYQLHCTGPRVYPITKLHLKWLRGNKVVKSVNSTDSRKLPDDVTPLVNILDLIASKTDDGQVYTCLAELDLDTNTTKVIKSSSVTLQTYFLPEPRILNRKPIVVNEEVTLECEVHNVYPAENLTVTWFQNDEELKSVTKTSASHDIWATTWTPQDTGLTELTCRADFEDYPLNLTRSDNISIEVYVFSEPVIQAPLTIVVGKPVDITCSVFNASGKLQLALKNGNTTLARASSSTKLTIDHTVHPKMELNGQQLTCEAELTLQHHSETIVKQQKTTLNVQPKGNGFEVVMNTDTPAVEIGGSLNVTCTTTCLNPTIDMELKSGLKKNCLQVNNSNTCQFPVVEKWNLPVVCIVMCKSENNTQKEVKKQITVYNRDLVIAPHPEVMEINKTYQLHCTGPRVYPITKLHLKWFRGNKVVKSVNSTNSGKPAEHVTPLVNILDLIASKTDDGQVYTCLAELDLDTITTKVIKSSSVTLQTYFFSEPVIQAPLTIIVGKPVDITCSVFNASGNLQLALKNGNMILERASSNTELTIYHTVHPKMELNGQQLTCEAELTLQHRSETIVKQQKTTLNVQQTTVPSTGSEANTTSVPTSTTVETTTGSTSASTTEATTTFTIKTLTTSGEEWSRVIIMGFLIFVLIILIAIICYYRINRARKTEVYLNPTQ